MCQTKFLLEGIWQRTGQKDEAEDTVNNQKIKIILANARVI